MIHILQNGFWVRAGVGCSVKEFLSRLQNLSLEYITKRISTIFLDGKPVDDIHSAVIQDGSTLALSGAMPGLVGAVMRHGSFYASFRSSITYKERHENSRQEKGMVRLKLFNIVMKELGPHFLGNGIFVQSSDLSDFFAKQSKEFRQGCKDILLNREPVEFSDLTGRSFDFLDERVFLTVNAKE